MSAPSPNAMPRKTNQLHQQILASLTDTKPSTWEQKLFDKDDNLVKKKITNQELRKPLSRNVSEANIEIAAKRWMR